MTNLIEKKEQLSRYTNRGTEPEDSSARVVEYEDIPLYSEYHNGEEHKFYA